MDKKLAKFEVKYQELINDVDRHSKKLTSIHSKHLHCKMGCDLCCMDYRIFPVEFHTILNRIRKDKSFIKPEKQIDESTCIFLKNHACTIYENRPCICRTHGLPLLYMNDDNEWELSNCELNFTDFDFDEFDSENTFPMDRFNSKLFVLNKQFISEFGDKKYNEFELIPLKKLVDSI